MYEGYETDLFQLISLEMEYMGNYRAEFQLKERTEIIPALFNPENKTNDLWTLDSRRCELFTDSELHELLSPLLFKIENEIILKNEKETPVPIVYNISFSSTSTLKKDFIYTSYFCIQNDKRKFSLSFLYSSDSNAWRYFTLEEKTEEKDRYQTLRPRITLTYPDFVFDQVMDQFISLLKEHPSTRIQATLIGNNRIFDCSLYEEIKAYKKKNA